MDFGNFNLELFGEWQIFFPGQETSASHIMYFNNSNCFANKIHIEMFIKFITLFLITEQQYLVSVIFIKLLFILNPSNVCFSFMHEGCFITNTYNLYIFVWQFKLIWAG